jgi:F420-dependent oxidoreductase-like protein
VRIGLGINTGGPLDTVLERFVQAEREGCNAAWVSNPIAGYDAMILCSLAGRLTSTIELGTFVVPTYPRHPAVMAGQALTTAAATGNRFTLGIGLSHRIIIEDQLGLDFSKPVGHTREYLTILNAALAGEPAKFEGKQYRTSFQAGVTGATKPPLLVAALGPQMLKVAGALADGIALWMAGPKYIETLALPTASAAAKEAGRPAPRILAGFPIAVTSDADAGKAQAAKSFGNYNNLPSYRGAMDVEGASGPIDIAIVGDEATIRAKMKQYADLGVTDFQGSPFGIPSDPDCRARTIAFLGDVGKRGL